MQYIDAAGEDFFAEKTNNNEMFDVHVARIVTMFDNKENVAQIVETVDQAKIIEQCRSEAMWSPKTPAK